MDGGWLTSGDWLPLGVLLGIVLLLILYIRRCSKLGSEAGDELSQRSSDSLFGGFADDIILRANLGLTPDWTRYLEEAERKHDAAAESMRNLATAALATGVGGTMAMLLLHFGFAAPESAADPIPDLFSAMTQALLASASGVAANIVILLWQLPRATKRFAVERKGFRKSLERKAQDHTPKSPGTADSRHEPFKAERMHAAVEDLGSSVAELVDVSRSLPSSAKSLAPRMERLAGTIAGLQASSSAEAGALRDQLESFPDELGRTLRSSRDGWSAEMDALQRHLGDILADAVDQLRTSVDAGRSEAKELRSQLGSFPERLNKALADSRDDWRKDLEELQGQLRETIEAHGANLHEIAESLETWRDGFAKAEEQRASNNEEERRAHKRFMRDSNSIVTDILTATRDLPGAFAGQVERSADRLGREFGREAGTHLTDFREVVKRRNDALLAAWEQHVRRMLAEMGHLVHQGLEPTVAGLQNIAGEVRDTVQALASESQTLNDNLEGAARALADSTAHLAAAHETTRDGIRNAEATYKKINDKILRVVERLERAERSRGTRLRKLRRWVRGIFPGNRANARPGLRSRGEVEDWTHKDTEE